MSEYHNRFDGKYEALRFVSGRNLQSAELNEIQSTAAAGAKSIGDAVFKDGDVIAGAEIVVNPATGAVQCGIGQVYLRGLVRAVPARNFTIPKTGSIKIGVRLDEAIVTEAQDPTLLDPATGVGSYGEPGAERLRVIASWGHAEDGRQGEFYTVYYVDDGHLRTKEPPPASDTMLRAIAAYDRDSTGSNYVVSGMKVSALPNESGKQVYNLEEGRARVNGAAINIARARRIVYDATPLVKAIASEPKISDRLTLQRVDVNRPPINRITAVRITRQLVSNIVRGTVAGSSDPLSETTIVDIISIRQDAKTYVKNTDYRLVGGQVDWSLSGDEPAPGSTYVATFQYIATVTPQDADKYGFSVLGAVVGTQINVDYETMLPRIDRLCLDDEGRAIWIQGVSVDRNPVRPPVPGNLLALAQIVQTWGDVREINNDGTRMVPMLTLESMGRELVLLRDMVAHVTLRSTAAAQESVAMKGVFTDPFLDDSKRDGGVAQTAASADGILTLPITATPLRPSTDVTKREVCAFTLESVVSNTTRTGEMKVNPYQAFAIPPSVITLTPAIDRWTEPRTTFTSPVTNLFNVRQGEWRPFTTTTVRSTEVAGVSSGDLPFLRQITVSFRIEGFGPGETLTSVTFDGIPVTATT